MNNWDGPASASSGGWRWSPGRPDSGRRRYRWRDCPDVHSDRHARRSTVRRWHASGSAHTAAPARRERRVCPDQGNPRDQPDRRRCHHRSADPEPCPREPGGRAGSQHQYTCT